MWYNLKHITQKRQVAVQKNEPRLDVISRSGDTLCQTHHPAQETHPLEQPTLTLNHERLSCLRTFFSDADTDPVKYEQLKETLRFLEDFSPLAPARKNASDNYEHLSFGSTDQGDIFCMLADEINQTNTRLIHHNVLNGQTTELKHQEVPVHYDEADIAYRQTGSMHYKRQFNFTINDTSASIILSGRGNRFIAHKNPSETPHEQPLSDCSLLYYELLHDKKTRASQTALAQLALTA